MSSQLKQTAGTGISQTLSSAAVDYLRNLPLDSPPYIPSDGVTVEHEDPQISSDSLRNWSDRQDVFINIYATVGHINKNMSPSAWRKSTIQQRFAVGTAYGHQTTGIANYRNSILTPRYQDGAVIGYYVSSYSSVLVLACDNSTYLTTFTQSTTPNVPYIMQLHDALVAKERNAFQHLPNPNLAGAFTILHSGPKLDLDLLALQATRGPVEITIPNPIPPPMFTEDRISVPRPDLFNFAAQHPYDVKYRDMLLRFLVECPPHPQVDEFVHTLNSPWHLISKQTFIDIDSYLSIHHIPPINSDLVFHAVEKASAFLDDVDHELIDEDDFDRLEGLIAFDPDSLSLLFPNCPQSILYYDHAADLRRTRRDLKRGVRAYHRRATAQAHLVPFYHQNPMQVSSTLLTTYAREYFATHFPNIEHFDTDAEDYTVDIIDGLDALIYIIDYYYPPETRTVEQHLRALRFKDAISERMREDNTPRRATAQATLVQNLIMSPETRENIATTSRAAQEAATLVPDVREAVNEMRATVAEIRQAFPADTRDRITSLLETFTRSSVNAGLMFDNIADTARSVAQLIVPDSTPRLIQKAIDIIMIIVDTIDGSYDFTWSSLAKVITRLLSAFDFTAALVSTFLSNFSPIIQSITSYFSPETNTENSEVRQAQVQAGAGDLLSLSSALVGTLILGFVPDKKDAKQVVESARAFNTLVPSCKNLSELITALCSYIPECIKDWFRWLCPSEDLYYRLTVGGEFKTWLDRVVEVTSDDVASRVTYDYALQAEVMTLSAQGRLYLTETALSLQKEHNTPMVSLITTSARKLLTMEATIRSSRAGRAARPTPFCLALTGKPGVGKSSLADVFVRLLAPEKLEDGNLIYARVPGQSYWSGYTGQFCTFIDDFYQIIDSKDAEELFSMISTAPYPLEMASLDNVSIGVKGTTFTSPFVLLTTNCAYPSDTQNIRNTEALRRRRHMLVEIVLKPQFYLASGLPNYALFQTDLSHLEFHVLDPVNPTGSSGNVRPTLKMELPEFFDYLYKAYQSHVAAEARMTVDRSALMTTINQVKKLNIPTRPATAQADRRAPKLHLRSLDDVSDWSQSSSSSLSSSQTSREIQALLQKRAESLEKLKQEDLEFKDTPDYTETLVARIAQAAESREKSFEDFHSDILRHKRQIDSSYFKVSSETNDLESLIASIEAGPKPEPKSKVTDLLGSLKQRSTDWLTAHPRVAMALKISTILLAFGIPAALIVTYLKKKGNREATLVPEAYSDRDAARRRASKRAKLVPEGAADPGAHELTLQRILPSMVTLVVNNEPSAISLNAFAFKGTALLTCTHLFIGPDGTLIPAGADMRITTAAGTQVMCKFDPTHLKIHKNKDGIDTDVCVYVVGAKKMNAFVDNTSHFVRTDTLEFITHFDAQIISTHILQDGVPRSNQQTVKTRPILRPTVYTSIDGNKEFLVQKMKGWEYDAVTVSGQCGSLLVAHNTRMPNKIVGIHVAGVSGQNIGISELVTYEQIMALLSEIPQVAFAQGMAPLPDLDECDTAAVVVEGNFTYVGVLPPSRCPRSPDTTQIVKSPLHGLCYPPLTEPAALTPKDPRLNEPYPLLKRGCEKFGRPCRALDPIKLRKAIDHTIEVTNTALSRHPRFILNEQQALNGLPGIDHCESLNMQTSPGYPYTLIKTKSSKGKSFLFEGEVPNLTINHPTLRENLDHRESEALLGRRVPSLWVANLKDERRPIEKMKIGKTRTFIFAPVDLTILSRKYFGAFKAAFFSENCKFYSAAGMNPESNQWDAFARSLLAMSDVGFAGDFGNYDGTLLPEVLDGCREVIDAWYGERNVVRDVLFEEFIHTQMCCMNFVFYKHSGNPSGNPLTTEINSIANAILMAYVWQVVAPPEYSDLSFFAQFVRFFVYGDDNIVAVKRIATTFFNMKTASAAYTEFGMEYTPPDKTSAVSVDVAPILSWTFLKRGFRSTGTHFVPLLSEITITESTNWIRESSDPWANCLESCSNGLRFAFFYGPTYYNNMRDKIIAATTALGKPFALPTYGFFQDFFLREGGVLPSIAYEATGPELYYEYRTAVAQAETSEVALKELQGVTNVESTTPIHASVPQATDKHPSAIEHLPDQIWNLNALAEKPVLVNTYNWSTSAGGSTILDQWYTPIDFETDSINHAPFNLFAYWRGETVVTVQVNATRFHSGRLALFFVPLTMKTTVANWHVVNLAALTSVPHVLIDPAVNTIAELRVPFVNQLGYLNIRDPSLIDFVGTVSLIVLNPLQAGTGTSTSVNVNVTVSFQKNEFKVPVPLGLTRDAMTASEFEILEKLDLSRNDRRGYFKDAIRKRVRRGIVQGGVTSFTYNFKDVAKATIGNVATTTDEIGHGAKGELEATGAGQAGNNDLDKPSNPMEPFMIVRNALGFFNNASNIIHIERLCTHPGHQTFATGETFSTMHDEMLLANYFKMLNISAGGAVSTTNAPNTIIDSGPICPMPNSLMGTWLNGNDYGATTLDIMSMKFSFWRGSIVVRYQFIVSAFHTMKLWFGVHYGTTSIPTNIDDATSQYGVYLDINGEGEHEFDIEIPFNTPYPALRVPNGPETGVNMLRFCSGFYSLRVINPLVAPTGVATNAPFNKWLGATEDFQVHYLGGNNASIVPYQDNVSRRIIRDETPRQAQAQGKKIVVGVANTLANDNPFGETIRTIADCTKRFTRFNINTAVPNNGVYSQLFDIGMTLFYPDNDFNVAPPPYARNSGLISYFGCFFRGYRGSLRFKWSLISPSKSARVQYAYTPDAAVRTDSLIGANENAYLGSWASQGAVLITPFTTSHAASYAMISPPIVINDPTVTFSTFEIPYVSPYKFLMIPQDLVHDSAFYSTDFMSQGNISYIVEDPINTTSPPEPYSTSQNYCLDNWVATGDEFRFGLYLGPTSIYVLAQTAFPDNYT